MNAFDVRSPAANWYWLIAFIAALAWTGTCEAGGKPAATPRPHLSPAPTSDAVDGLFSDSADAPQRAEEPIPSAKKPIPSVPKPGKAGASGYGAGVSSEVPYESGRSDNSFLPVAVSVAGDVVVLVVIGFILYLINKNQVESLHKLNATVERIKLKLETVSNNQNATSGRTPETDKILGQIEGLKKRLDTLVSKPRDPGPTGSPRPGSRQGYGAGTVSGLADSRDPFFVGTGRPDERFDGVPFATEGQAARQSLETALCGRLADVQGAHPAQLTLARARLGNEDLFEERPGGPFVGYREGDVVLVVPAPHSLSDADHFHAQFACLFDCSAPTRGDIHVDSPARLKEVEHSRFRTISRGTLSIP